MAPDTFTEVSRQSWGSRLGGSIKGILVGFIFIGLGLLLLFWNEGRAVKRARALDQGAAAVVTVAPGSVDPAREGHLVHLSDMVAVDEILEDREFGIAVQALHLRRNVEMYQWQETTETKEEKKLGGGTETTTTYDYRKAWLDHRVDSSSFRRPAGHENPASMPFHGKDVSASTASIGAFGLSSSLIGRISNWEKVTVGGTSLLPEPLRSRARLYGDGFYLGDDPTSPRVGDVKVHFDLVKPSAVSVVARQEGSSLRPWPTRNGQTVELLAYGMVPPEVMFESAHRGNKLMSWILRLVGFVLIMAGINAILRPLSVMGDVIPAIGNLVGRGTKALSFFLAGFLALCTIGVAWIFYRPLLGITLLLLALGAIVVALKMVRRARAAPPSEAPPATTGPPPPPAPPPAPTD